MFKFDNSYARLPDRFFAGVFPEAVSAPRLIRFNRALAEELALVTEASHPVTEAVESVTEEVKPEYLAEVFSGNLVPVGAEPLAMAYAGHQFGNFVPQLGDGRAILLGEVIDTAGKRRDIQLKGAGPTPFSRRGDGRAALGPVLREYIVSEAFAALGIPATRALAAVATGDAVQRETLQQGAVLTRVAASHIRIGTFQYFAARQDHEALKILVETVIERHYPALREAENPALAMLQAVSDRQAKLIARWLSVGFIHGVMNTDNMTLSGETIDFGPCAFLDEYDPAKVFSSIDRQGRYAYGNQPGIGQWNIARLAECLLGQIDEDDEKAVDGANAVLKSFGETFQTEWQKLFCVKIGLFSEDKNDGDLVRSLLDTMQQGKADFTLAFRALAQALTGDDQVFLDCFTNREKANAWLARWRERLTEDDEKEQKIPEERAAFMASVNPAIIPRNHKIEEAIAAANYGDFSYFERMVEALQKPYQGNAEYALPPRPDERVTATFCGT